MTYRIFVSHTESDLLIVDSIVKEINDAFEGDIKLYLANREIIGGDEWKEAIKDNLKENDALICLVSSENNKKPWLYIEWGAFWVAGKKYYLLLTDEVKITDLVHPMQDCQVTYIQNILSVKKLFKALAEDSKHSPVPYERVQPFIASVNRSMNLRNKEIAEREYGIYKNNPDALPSNDTEKKIIADYFYKIGDYKTFDRVVDYIRDEMVKYSIVLELIQYGDLEKISQITEKIIGADKLGEITRRLIDLQQHDSSQVKVLIESIAQKNQSELRNVAIYLLNRGEIETTLFEYIIDLIRNMTDLRKIACHLIANGQQEMEMFDFLIKKMFEFNQREAEKVLIELNTRDKALFEHYLQSGLITNYEVLNRLQKLNYETDSIG